MATTEQSFSQLDEFQVIKTLGKGASAKVKLVKDEQGNQFAAKIMIPINPIQMQRFKIMVENEVELVKQIDHPNIVKVFRCKENGVYVKKNGETKQVMYILMEYCAGGEVFEFLYQTGAFSDEMTRAYFKQLINAIEAVHNAGITHRDLKPENLLLDSNFNLKITDFGFATVLSGRDGSGMLKTQLGSEIYMAPEIHEGKSYIGRQVDLFACGIILFIFKTQNPPWKQAIMIDPLFKVFSGTNPNKFWNEFCQKKKNPNLYSITFKNLMHCMCSYEPSERLSISEIKAHPYWNDGQTASLEQILNEFKIRQRRVFEAAEKMRMDKKKLNFQAGYGRTAYGQGRVFRSIGQMGQSSQMAMSIEYSDYGYDNSGSLSSSQSDTSLIGMNTATNRKIAKYNKTGLKWTQFVTLQDKEEVLNALESWVSKNDQIQDYKISENQYKILVKASWKDQGNVEFQIKLYQHEDRIIADFIKLSGISYAFNMIYSAILASPEVSDLVNGELASDLM